MANDQTKVISGRNFIVYTVPWHPTVTTPADTISYGTAWATPAGQTGAWVESGYTDGGVNVSMTVDRGEIRVDQELEPILRPATGRTTTFETTLAQFTAQNLKNAAGQGSITTVNPASGARGHDDLDVSSTIADVYISAGLDFLHPGDNEAFRVFMWKCLPQGGVNAAFNPEDKATIPFALNAFPDTSVVPARILKFRDVIAALP